MTFLYTYVLLWLSLIDNVCQQKIINWRSIRGMRF